MNSQWPKRYYLIEFSKANLHDGNMNGDIMTNLPSREPDVQKFVAMSDMGAIATIRFEVGRTVATRQVRSLEDVDTLLAERVSTTTDRSGSHCANERTHSP